jgi:hypothetical protein
MNQPIPDFDTATRRLRGFMAQLGLPSGELV